MRASTGLSLAIAWGAVTFSHVAFAQSDPLGAGGRLILSADRLSGLSFSKQRTEDGESDNVSTASRTEVAFLWRPTSISPYTVPQVGLDVGVVGGFTVGAAVGFFTQSGETETEAAGGASTSRDSPSVTAFTLVPRVGYGISIVPWLAFWGRLGITYYNLHSSQESTAANPIEVDTTSSGVGLNLEPTFVFVPVAHFGIMAGPYLDLPLSGSVSTEATMNGVSASPPDDSVKYTSFGLKAGLLGAFL
jgi:hypothetical protein